MSDSNSRCWLAFVISGSATVVFAFSIAFSALAGTPTDQSAASDQASDSEMVGKEIDPTEIDRVLALSDDVAYGEYLAGECASCHSLNTTDGSNVPVIHGAAPEHIARSLLEYREGFRTNTTMVNVAISLGDEEVAVLSHYLATVGR